MINNQQAGDRRSTRARLAQFGQQASPSNNEASSEPRRKRYAGQPEVAHLTLQRSVRLFLQGYFSTCRRSWKTYLAYSSDLRQFASGAPHQQSLAAVSPEMIEEWASNLKQAGYAPATLRRKLSTLAVFFRYCIRRQLLERSPLWSLRFDVGSGRSLTRTLDDAEVDRLLDYAASELRSAQIPSPRSHRETTRLFIAARNHALVEFLFATGVRVGEAAAVSVEDVLLDQRTVIVHGKGNRQRLAFLVDARSFKALRGYLRLRRPVACASSGLFLNAANERLSTEGMRKIVADLARGAGIVQHVRPHMIRHTIATRLLRNGADLRVVQEFLGHASISMTQRYTHVAKDHLVASLRAAHPNARPRAPGPHRRRTGEAGDTLFVRQVALSDRMR